MTTSIPRKLVYDNGIAQYYSDFTRESWDDWSKIWEWKNGKAYIGNNTGKPYRHDNFTKAYRRFLRELVEE